jgi:hypothetical protein
MTNGIYKSIEHRATVNSENESPALFKTITVEEYVDGFLASKIKGKSYLDVVKIKH